MAQFSEGHVYDQDGLRSEHNHEFMDDPAFQAAYGRGMQAAGMDYGWPWRVHVGLWAARGATRLAGDFVECGVGHGFMSSAIMKDLDWDRTGRTFYLLDTFKGLDERYVSPEELAHGAMAKSQQMIDVGMYTQDALPAFRNFAEWKNAKVVVGPVPETLAQVTSREIAFLHIDMNCSPPEVAAITHLWDRLSPGAFVLLDDYAYNGYRSQKVAMDAFARSKGVDVLSLPTGQGLIVKPATRSRFDRALSSLRTLFGSR